MSKSKSVGMGLGALTVIVGLGYGLVFALGRSLGKALSSSIDNSAADTLPLAIFFSLITAGLITGAGSYGLSGNGGRKVYFAFCVLVGVCFLVSFLILIGSLGELYEGLILCLSILYFLLGYLVVKKL
ncbi:hypothetical protein [Metabacillus sp. RGM 3146]|uniref:hypothetical protein n=1 Tax=Metabacillus sp. RGM 3146 TaxID=3401092 RepID=UPI003B9A5145